MALNLIPFWQLYLLKGKKNDGRGRKISELKQTVTKQYVSAEEKKNLLKLFLWSPRIKMSEEGTQGKEWTGERNISRQIPMG